MFKKGFVSSYFLYIMLITTLIISTFFIQINYKLKTAYNLRIINNYLMQESIIINFIKCELYNNRLIDNDYNVSNVNFTVKMYPEIIVVYVNTSLPETINISILQEEDSFIITDYHTSISEQYGL